MHPKVQTRSKFNSKKSSFIDPKPTGEVKQERLRQTVNGFAEK